MTDYKMIDDSDFGGSEEVKKRKKSIQLGTVFQLSLFSAYGINKSEAYFPKNISHMFYFFFVILLLTNLSFSSKDVNDSPNSLSFARKEFFSIFLFQRMKTKGKNCNECFLYILK